MLTPIFSSPKLSGLSIAVLLRTRNEKATIHTPLMEGGRVEPPIAAMLAASDIKLCSRQANNIYCVGGLRSSAQNVRPFRKGEAVETAERAFPHTELGDVDSGPRLLT